jgi:hypothetical protein
VYSDLISYFIIVSCCRLHEVVNYKANVRQCDCSDWLNSDNIKMIISAGKFYTEEIRYFSFYMKLF